jgi:hypothetical protein
MKTVRFAAAAAAAFACASAIPVRADAPCDGVYRSWGRACYGAAYVRNKTIEWNAQFSTCKPSPYEVIHSELGGGKPRVAYRFKKRSKACGYEVMEIVAQREGYWAIRGYQSVDDYRQRRDDPVAYDSCPVAPMASERCDLPFASKKD